ncbi:MAG: hypothetical protein KA734_12555 [Fluviicola sp.]|nr:hypothetical protein [Fluviicola sp.]MBP6271922.1 hypothetical protein [Fluviicola sp.]
MLKSKVNLIMVFVGMTILLSCENKLPQKKTIVNVQKNEYQTSQILGEWDVYQIEIVEGRYNPISKNKVLFKRNITMDSLKINFESDGSIRINSERNGEWNFINDSISIKNVITSIFPLNINSDYKVHRGYFNKSWFLYTSFYDKRGKISHSIKLSAKRKK